MRAVFALLVVGCGGAPDPEETADEVVLRFAAEVDGAPLACGQTFEGGAPATTFEVLDLRFYVHDVVLLGGEEVAAPLVVDAPWQSDVVALVDPLGCETGELRDAVRVEAPAGDYTGLRFTLGVAPADNHLNTETATPPLDEVDLWWGWRFGYKYVKLDVTSAGREKWVFHMGASDCDGDESSGYTCAQDNLPVVELDGFDPASGEVVFDLGALLSGTDLDGTDGCQTGEADPDCVPLFERLGIPFEDAAAGSAQVVFSGR